VDVAVAAWRDPVAAVRALASSRRENGLTHGILLAAVCPA
jgi:hypothetical protein